mgnify:CR=1 FL=1
MYITASGVAVADIWYHTVLIYMYMMAIGTLFQELSAHPQLSYHTVTTLPTRPSCTVKSSLFTTSVTLGMS